MDQCTCGNMKDACEFECAECKAKDEAGYANKIAWISAEKQAYWGDRTALNDLIDQSND